MKQFGILLFLCICTNLFAQESAQQPTSDFKSTYKAYNSAYQAGDFKAALEHALLAVELGKVKYGEDSKNYTNLLYNLALMQRQNRKNTDAVATMQQVVERKELLFGVNSVEHFLALLELIQMNEKVFDKKATLKSNDLAKRAIKITDYLVQQHPEKAGVLQFELATVLMYPMVFQKRYRDAKKYMTLAEKNLLATFGSSDRRAITAKFDLARIDLAGKKYRSAAEKLEQVIAAINEHMDTSHPYELAAHARLVEVYEKLGKSDQATEHCQAIGAMTPWNEDIEPTPLFRAEPEYPMSYARKGREGWAILSFNINPTGFVTNIEPLETEGGKKFAKESIAALEKWRYAPKFENGVPVVAENLKVRLDFKLGK